LRAQRSNPVNRLDRFVAALLAMTVVAFATVARADPHPLCGGQWVALHIDQSGSPIAHLALAGKEGDFLIDTGSTMSIVNADSFGIIPHSLVTLKGFSLPTVAEASFRAWDWLAHDRSIIGTDILRTRTIEIRYGPSEPYLALSDGPCAAAGLESAGFARIDQRGYYGIDETHKPALPVVFVRIGTVTAPFFLDTGRADFGDGGLLAVSEPYRDLLAKAGVAMRHVTTSHISDCRGEDSEAEVVRLTERLGIRGQAGGADLASYDTPSLLVLPDGAVCGNRDAPAKPFGLLGSSFLRKWGTVIIDPFSHAVWLKLG
jgi:hypothetical protein